MKLILELQNIPIGLSVPSQKPVILQFYGLQTGGGGGFSCNDLAGCNVSLLTNDAGYVNAAQAAAAAPVQSVNGQTNIVVLDANDVGAYPDTNPSNFVDAAGAAAAAPIQSVTGTAVDNTDPANPVIELVVNLILYPTTAASPIVGYSRMVTTVTDPAYNTVAADVNTGSITGVNQLVASLASDAGVLIGNPGIFNLRTVGNIRRTAGTGEAVFYFEVYKRNLAGVETLIGTSSNTLPVDTNVYAEYDSDVLFNNGDFISTDRIVIKWYASKTGVGSNPSFQIQFGGVQPVRSLFPVPSSVITTRLADLQDVDLATPETTPAVGDKLLIQDPITGIWQPITWANILAAIPTGGGSLIALKTAPQTTTSATLANITDLGVTIGANEKKYIEWILEFTATPAAGVRFAVTVPTGASLWARTDGNTGAQTTFTTVPSNVSGTQTAIVFLNLNSTAQNLYVRIWAVVQNGANAGTVNLQFKSETAGQTTTVGANGTLVKSEDIP